jgi:hypothetical protein
VIAESEAVQISTGFIKFIENISLKTLADPNPGVTPFKKVIEIDGGLNRSL